MINNNLNHFKIFLEECDILSYLGVFVTFAYFFLCFLRVKSFHAITFTSWGFENGCAILLTTCAIISSRYTYKFTIMRTPKTRKSQFSPSKSTENIFSVDNKSTVNFPKPAETRYQLTSLLKNTKMINIDQL